MSLYPRNKLPRFREHYIIRKFPKSGFLPLYDLAKLRGYTNGLLAPDMENPKKVVEYAGMMELSHMWMNVNHDIILSKDATAIKLMRTLYPEFSNVSNLVILYSARHALELTMKSYLNLINEGYIKSSHNLAYLYHYHDVISNLLKQYDHIVCKDSSYSNTNNITQFIDWLSSFEEQSTNKSDMAENPYRYFLNGENKMLLGDIYLNFERINIYVSYCISVVEWGAWDYIVHNPDLTEKAGLFRVTYDYDVSKMFLKKFKYRS